MKKIILILLLTVLLLPQASMARVMLIPSPTPTSIEQIEGTTPNNGGEQVQKRMLAPLQAELPQLQESQGTNGETSIFQSPIIIGLGIFVVLIGLFIIFLKNRKK
jgi:hypothetical protein